MSLQHCIERMRRLAPNTAQGVTSPHKMCMMLAVIDLARAGALRENRIHFESPALRERYYAYFSAVAMPGQHPNPFMPFYHLSGKLKGGMPSFWHLQPKPGCELKTPRSNNAIHHMIAWAYLDDELFAVLRDDVQREELAKDIARFWFQRGLTDLGGVFESAQQISVYEKSLRGLTMDGRAVREVPVTIRDPAFRRVVTEKYDYRCAATHLRVLLPDGRAMVQAAHIYPVSEGANDDPRNGLALTPDMQGLGYESLEEAFRRMVFNVMARNCDDHSKNFAFRLQEGRAWELAPAYNVTFAHNPKGEWTHQHLMSVNGKFKDFTREDLMAEAHRFGVGTVGRVIGEVAVHNWPGYAAKAGLGADQEGKIGALHWLPV